MEIDGVRAATISDIDWLSGRLRPEHVREAEGLSIGAAGRQLAESFFHSAGALCGIRNGRPVYAMGILNPAPLGGYARVWMLGTAEIDLYPRWLIRGARYGIGEGFRLTAAHMIGAWLPLWYSTGIAFLDRLGFLPLMEQPHGLNGDSHVLMIRKRGKQWDRRQRRQPCSSD